MTEIYLSYSENRTDLYKNAVYNLAHKAYAEQAVFPIEVKVTNGLSETWSATVAIKHGLQFDVKHHSIDSRGVSIAFPLRMVAIDSRGDRVASMDVLLPEWEN